MFTINQNLIDDFADKINEKEKKSNKVTSLSSSSTDTQYPSAKCVYDTVDIVDDKVSVVYNTVSIIDTSDSVYDADRWAEDSTLRITQQSGSKVIVGGGGGYVIYDGNISNLDNYDITLNLTPSKKNTRVYINDNDIGTLPTSQTSILFKKRDGVVKVVYDNNQYDSSSVQIVSFNVLNRIIYTIDVVLYQGMIYDVIDSIPSKTSDLTNDSGYLTAHQNISGKEDKSNKVTSISSSSTDTEYPSAKAVFDSLPSVPSASSVTPSADTTNGSVGDGTTWARSNHTHPKSSLYAEASHTHSQYLTSHQSLEDYIQKSSTTGLIKNDGTIDTNTYATTSSVDASMTGLNSSLGSALNNAISTVNDRISNLNTSNIISSGESLNNIGSYNGTIPQSTINGGINTQLGTINTKISSVESSVATSKHILEATRTLDGSRVNLTINLSYLTTITDPSVDFSPLYVKLPNDMASTTGGVQFIIKYNNSNSTFPTQQLYSMNGSSRIKENVLSANEIIIIGWDSNKLKLLKILGKEYSTVAETGSYNDLTDKPTIPTKTSDLINDSSFLTSHQSLTGYLQTSDVKDNLTSTDTNKPLSAKQGKELKTLVDGKANSSHTHTKSQITDFPTIPSKTSQLTNDSGFLTTHQSLSNYYNKSETNNYDVDFILGTQTASTSAWTGTTDVISSLREGTTIFYKLPYASTSTSVTLNLTLKGGGTTGAKNVFYKNTTRLTNHYGVGQVVGLTYNGTAWYVISPSDNNSNNDNNYGGIQFKAGEALTTQTICCAKDNGQYYKVANGVVLDIRYPLIMTSSAVASGTTTNAMYRTWYGVNIANTKSITLTNGSQLFLEGTAYSDGKFTISSNVVTHTLTNGRYYIKVGTALSTTQIRFISDMTVYYYNGTTLKPVIKKEQIVDFPTIPSETSQITDSSAYNNLKTSSNATQSTINSAIDTAFGAIQETIGANSPQIMKVEYMETTYNNTNDRILYVQLTCDVPITSGNIVAVSNDGVSGSISTPSGSSSTNVMLCSFGIYDADASDTFNIVLKNSISETNDRVITDGYSFSHTFGNTNSNWVDTGYVNNSYSIRNEINSLGNEIDSLNTSITNLGDVDTGWVTLSWASNFATHSSGQDAKVRRVGKIVQFTGWAKPTINMTIDADHPKTICTLPEQFRPNANLEILCQGSQMAIFLLNISPNGTVQVSRYRFTNSTSSTYPSVSSGAWLPFNTTWIVP